MVTALKVSKDLNSTTLEELVSYLRSHEIEMEEYEPQRKGKSLALKSKGKTEKVKPFQDKEEEEESEEDSDEEDELSLLSIRVNQLWRKRQKQPRGIRRTCRRFESTSGLKKSCVKNMSFASSGRRHAITRMNSQAKERKS